MNSKLTYPFLLLFFMAALVSVTCDWLGKSLRETIDLKGLWHLRLDPQNIGLAEKWFTQTFSDSVRLPGTLDENRKGEFNRDSTDMHLNRAFTYIGAAWYQSEIDLPQSWLQKHVELVLERTKVTHVWLDTLYLGNENTLFSKQVYDLTGKFTRGKHKLTILVDNNPDLVPVATSHAYEENTQTNWNGILGQFSLQAGSPVKILTVKTFPDIHSRQVKVRVQIANPGSQLKQVEIELSAKSWNTQKKQSIPVKSFPVETPTAEVTVELNYPLGEHAQLWSEFNPALYKLQVSLKGEKQLDEIFVDFGLREFKTAGTNFSINGLKTFLRGKMEGCVFPLTGYPPMDPEEWVRVFRVAKSYGLNHYRFHSWCPPEAAFKAADICGIYLQPELPIWQKFDAFDSLHVDFMMQEGRRLLENYGNHASLVMFALGNEISQDRTVLKQMVDDLRQYDSRPLFAQGSNNHLSDPRLAEGDDYWTTFRTSPEKPDYNSDVRGSFSFLDSRDGGIINALAPGTKLNYTLAIAGIPVPVIGHEIGQYQIYPDYDEIAKYRGVLRPWNLEIFRQGLKERGMLDQSADFHFASGQLAVLCYRQEIEMALRTPGFGGFQLLDLQDFPGQGTALVGILDAFMESKSLIQPEEFRQFCSRVVLLLEVEKYCWENNETFCAEIKIANYGPTVLKNRTIKWSIGAPSGSLPWLSGQFSPEIIPQGELTPVGKIEMKLEKVDTAQKILIQLAMADTIFKNAYPIWVYPVQTEIPVPGGIQVVTRLSSNLVTQLIQGATVLFFPDFKMIEKRSVGGLFTPDFWNYAMFKMLAGRSGGGVSPGTLGILTYPNHPLFKEFPTEFHSDWQWWSILKNSRPLILDQNAKSCKLIVQVVDNINRNHKLGLIFEWAVGEGKLLVCMSNLPAISDHPEARQLYRCLLNYMESHDFQPTCEISISDLENLFE